MYNRDGFITAVGGKTPEEEPRLWNIWCHAWMAAKRDKPDVIYVARDDSAAGEFECEYVEEPRMLPVTALKINGTRYDVVESTSDTTPVNIEAVLTTAINWGKVYGAILDEDSWGEMAPTASARFASAVVSAPTQVKISLVYQTIINELFDLELVGIGSSLKNVSADAGWEAAIAACKDVVDRLDPNLYDDTYVHFAHDLAQLVHKHKDAIENEYDLNVLVYSFLNDFKGH